MGDNLMGQLGVGSNVGKGSVVTTPKPVLLQQKVKHAACGYDFTLFVTAKGFLYSAGSSESGQLGINDNGEYIEGRKVRFSLLYAALKVKLRDWEAFSKFCSLII